ncbi:hypothetical protein SNE40_009919 [Patella caerulea]|uniref:Uncharacterized protein n=1 Tax=Patella caerulea TaxID=87958 RepID=A0AAN8JUZ6_PATCE
MLSTNGIEVMTMVIAVVEYVNGITGCTRCQNCCQPQVPHNVWNDEIMTTLSNGTNEYNATDMDVFLTSAPCPPIWNLTLTLGYFTKTNMSCDQSVLVLNRCLTNYQDSISCEQKVELLKACLVASLCQTLHDMLTATCALCPIKCADAPSTNHSQESIFDDTSEASTDDDYEPSGESPYTRSPDVIMDITTATSVSSLTNCDILCLSIVIPLLLLLIIGVITAIVVLCKQDKEGKKNKELQKNIQIPAYENNIIPLDKIRPYSLHEDNKPRPHSCQEDTKPRITSIGRPISLGWNHEYIHVNGGTLPNHKDKH